MKAISSGLHYDASLDHLRELCVGVNWIATLQQEERDRTGIAKLKVGYNRVFSYYIEISRGQKLTGARGLRTQTNAGKCRTLHHTGIKTTRRRNTQCPRKDGIH